MAGDQGSVRNRTQYDRLRSLVVHGGYAPVMLVPGALLLVIGIGAAITLPARENTVEYCERLVVVFAALYGGGFFTLLTVLLCVARVLVEEMERAKALFRPPGQRADDLR